MAGKSKVVKKAEKASVRVASTKGGTVSGYLGEEKKENKLAIAAKGKAKSAKNIPGSRQDREPDAPKTSKSMAKRVNQSRVDRGAKPKPLYVSKADAAKDKKQSDRMQLEKKKMAMEEKAEKPKKS